MSEEYDFITSARDDASNWRQNDESRSRIVAFFACYLSGLSWVLDEISSRKNPSTVAISLWRGENNILLIRYVRL